MLINWFQGPEMEKTVVLIKRFESDWSPHQ